MVLWTRRSLATAAVALMSLAARRSQAAPDPAHAPFVEQAAAMKQKAIDAGDQAYGAVVVRNREIAGFGPSRVVVKKDSNAHAEREAIRDAQQRLGRKDLSDCVMYSTSRPCADCERAAAEARLARMYFGEGAIDAGAPRRSQ